MSTIVLLSPGTPVQIIPFAGCDNDTGKIVKSCAHTCCEVPTPSCEEYEVEYDFKSCTNCRRVVSTFCRFELVDLAP